MTSGPHLRSTFRRRAAAALAAAAVAATGLLIALDSAAAASSPDTGGAPNTAGVPAAAAGPSTAAAGGVVLTVDPASGLSAGGGSLAVTGSGFKTTGGLYVAICAADGKAPASLADCVGGPIPTANTTASWAHISAAGSATAQPGQVAAKWGNGGTFSVALTLPASNPASDALDCSQVACAVYTTPDAGTDPSQDLTVGLTYRATTTTSVPMSSTSSSPAGSSISSSPSPSTASTSSTVTSPPEVVTSTINGGVTTVQPKSIKLATVVAGGQQQVLFAGFTKGETVFVTLYSAALKLPAVKADADGVVTVDFTVPADLPAGTHLLEVVGQTSRVTGVASFQVSAPVASSGVASSNAVAVSSVSSAPVPSSAVVVPPVIASSAASSSSPVSSSAPVPVTPAATSSSKPVWPWYVLGVVVLLWIGFGLFMLQRRRGRLAAEMREKDRILAEGAAAEHARATEAVARANAVGPDSDASTTYLGPPADQPGGYTGYHPGEHELLAGRDDPDNPGLLSGTGYRPDPTEDLPTTGLPTTFFPPAAEPTVPASPAGADGPADTGGPTSDGGPTSYGGAASYGGPPTGTWTPDFTEENPTGGGAGGAGGAGEPGGAGGAGEAEGPGGADGQDEQGQSGGAHRA